MHLEIAYYSTNYHKQELLKEVFTAVEKKINGIAVHPYYIKTISKYLPKDITLSCPVDFPLGASDTKVRQHQTLSNISAGANTIDLSIQNLYLTNDKRLLKKDLKAIYDICKDKNATLRLIYEYRQNFEVKCFAYLKEVIQDIGIQYVFPSTGLFVDNYADNLIAGKAFGINTNLKVFCSGNIFTPQQYEIAKESNIFGIRYNNIQSYLNSTGV